jgi:hypothetical protein
MTKLQKLKVYLSMMNDRYSKRWDEELNQLLDENKIELKPNILGGVYKIKLGDIYVWVANYPYAYATSSGNTTIPNGVRPSRKTIIRLKEMMDKINTENKY